VAVDEGFGDGGRQGFAFEGRPANHHIYQHRSNAGYPENLRLILFGVLIL